MKISITIFEDAEAWLIENLPDMCSDNICGVIPITGFDPYGLTTYKDFEEGSIKKCTMQDHIKALQLLCDQVGQTIFVGGIKNSKELTDAGNWDIEVVDAYWQLVYYGKVIYG